MPGTKTPTLRYLRELARKHLGAGHTRLKTRDDLIAALRKAAPEVLGKEAKGATEKAPAASKAKAAAKREPGAKAVAAAKKVVAAAKQAVAAAKKAPAAKKEAAPKKEAAQERTPPAKKATVATKEAAPKEKKPASKKAPAAKKEAAGKAGEAAAAKETAARAEAPAERKAAQKKAAAKAAALATKKPAAPPEPTPLPLPEAQPAEMVREKPAPPPPPAPRPVPVYRFEKASSAAPALEPPPSPPVSAEPTAPPGPHAFAPAEPLVEGFFVARVAGEDEARQHHLTEDQAPPPVHTRGGPHPDERLEPLPHAYHDDRVVMLARDPRTLYLYWDFHPATKEAAFAGLDSPRALLRVYEGSALVRTVDLALESGSFYVLGLAPGRTYRAELQAVGADGTFRTLGQSNPVTLPSEDVSPDTTVRFLRVPWDVPLPKLRERLRARTPDTPRQPLILTHQKWVPLANSGSWQLITWNQTLPEAEASARAGVPPVAGSWHLGSSGWSGASFALPQKKEESR